MSVSSSTTAMCRGAVTPARLAPPSVRHQHGHRHRPEHRSRGAAQHQFTQTGVCVRAHHDHVAARIRRLAAST